MRLLASLLVALPLTLGQAVTGAAVPAAAAGCTAGVAGDVDGNGVGDLVVQAGRDGGQYQSGFDLIRYPGGQRTFVTVPAVEPAPEAALRLVAAAIGDLDGDGCAEVVIAGDVPNPAYSPIGSYHHLARAYVVPGSPEGPVLAKAVRIDLPGGGVQQLRLLPGARQLVLTTIDRTGGALVVHTLGEGLTAGNTRVVTGKSLKIAAGAPRDEFGRSLAASGHTIVVGSPAEKVSRSTSRGAVYVFSSPGLQRVRLTARSKGMPKLAAKSQRFGAAVAYLDGRLAIGAPQSQVGDHAGAGLVHLLRWNPTSRTHKAVRTFGQSTKGVPGAAGDWDLLGSQLVIARGLTASGSYDVVAGAPHDAVGKIKGAGSLIVTRFETKTYRRLTQNSAGIPGSVGMNRLFGLALAVRHQSRTSDSLLALSNQRDPECSAAMLLTQSRGGRLTSGGWSRVSPRDPALGCAESVGLGVSG